ncbi:MAG TPA: carboxymuconolactone decarboxylase family protein [Phycisphaerae bacterium]|nr:carboxymuconolactone decarboxylase family protein [Phycisphaerae bacterium]
MASKDTGPSGALPPKTRGLTALGCAFALRREDDIASYVAECLRAGATPEEIMEVLRLATVLAECPGDRYRAIIQQAIDAFGQ